MLKRKLIGNADHADIGLAWYLLAAMDQLGLALEILNKICICAVTSNIYTPLTSELCELYLIYKSKYNTHILVCFLHILHLLTFKKK